MLKKIDNIVVVPGNVFFFLGRIKFHHRFGLENVLNEFLSE